MLAVAEVAASVAAADSTAAACVLVACTAAREGFMAAAIALRAVHTPRIR
jgi:hypothetical protein